MNRLDKALLKVKTCDDYKYRGYEIKKLPNDCRLKEEGYGIYKDGKLISSADSEREAQKDIDKLMDEKYKKVYVTYDLIDKGDSLIHKAEEIPYSKKSTYLNELKRKYPKSNGWIIVNYTEHDSSFKINKALDKLVYCKDAGRSFSAYENYLRNSINNWYRNAKIDYGVNGKYVDTKLDGSGNLIIYYEEDGKRKTYNFGKYWEDYTPQQVYNVWMEQP